MTTGTSRRGWAGREGFSLMEFLIGASLLSIAVVSLMAVFVSEQTLNEHSRNLSWAVTDVARVMERMREQNNPGVCATVNVNPPTGYVSWDAWLASTASTGGGGKNLQPLAQTNELIVPTVLGVDPAQVTVAVCWRHRDRVLGECAWDGAALSADEGVAVPNDTPNVIDSPAMLSAFLTCRP